MGGERRVGYVVPKHASRAAGGSKRNSKCFLLSRSQGEVAGEVRSVQKAGRGRLEGRAPLGEKPGHPGRQGCMCTCSGDGGRSPRRAAESH